MGGQPVFDFGDHGFGVRSTGDRSMQGARLDDKGIAYGMAEMMQCLASNASKTRDGKPGYEIDRDTENVTSFYVTFTEVVIIGPLGPWALLKNGVEISSSSPFANFSPALPFVNSMQLQFQFDQDKLARNLFFMGRNGGDGVASTMKATFEQAHVMIKWSMPPQSH